LLAASHGPSPDGLPEIENQTAVTYSLARGIAEGAIELPEPVGIGE
jgi:hypothetical protein